MTRTRKGHFCGKFNVHEVNTSEEVKPERLVTNPHCHLQTNFRFHFTEFCCITV